jgi:hypothetical protein
MSLKEPDITVERRNNLVAVGHRKASAGQEIILDVNEEQGVPGTKPHLH